MSVSHERTNAPVEPMVFIPSVIVIGTVVLVMILAPDKAHELVGRANKFVNQYFSSTFLLFGALCLVASLWFYFTPYGRIKLGDTDDKPEFSNFSWVAMLFSAGVAIGLMIWSVVEPIYYIESPPLGIEAFSNEAYEWAHMLPLFHWGVSAWAIYCVCAIPIAYSVYNRKDKVFRLSNCCRSVMGGQVDRWPGMLIDTLVVLGTIGGMGTSIGLAIPLVSSLISDTIGLPDNFWLKLAVVAVWFMVFGGTVYTGLGRGIKDLSRINIYIAFGFLVYLLLVGPTSFIIDSTVNSIGLMLENFPRLLLQVEPLRLIAQEPKDAWPQWWTVFYWAWWIAYAPVTGIFIARISKGRQIKEIVLGACFWGTLGCWVFLSIIGGYSLFLQKSGLADLSGIHQSVNDAAACLALVKSLPLSGIVMFFYLVLCITLLATTLNAAAYTLSAICSKKGFSDLEPLRWHRVLWAFGLAIFGFGLLLAGGEKALKTVQTSTVVGGILLVPVIIVLLYCLVKNVKQDYGNTINPGPLARDIKKEPLVL